MENKGKFVVGNWKMHGDLGHLRAYSETFRSFKEILNARLIICPPYPYLIELSHLLNDSPFCVGSQGCHSEVSGAYTGDVSAQMLVDAGVRYVILGHSERRLYHGETSEFIRGALASAHHAGLIGILCVGEDLTQRGKGLTLKVLEEQYRQSLPPSATPENTLVAYEPLWAIGTGQAATVDKIQEVHQYLKDLSCHKDGKSMSIIYGGSVSIENAEEILSLKEVDGVLVGKASLAASSFIEIARAAHRAGSLQES